MEAARAVKEYFARRNIAEVSQTETVYYCKARLTRNSRISECEVTIREVEGDLVLTAVLPVVVRMKEAKGIARWLAVINDADREPGFFELDNLTGHIQYRVKMKGPLTAEELDEGLDYCIGVLEANSDRLIQKVCEETNSVRREEAAKARRARSGGLAGKILDRMGLHDPDEESIVTMYEMQDDDEDRIIFRPSREDGFDEPDDYEMDEYDKARDEELRRRREEFMRFRPEKKPEQKEGKPQDGSWKDKAGIRKFLELIGLRDEGGSESVRPKTDEAGQEEPPVEPAAAEEPIAEEPIMEESVAEEFADPEPIVEEPADDGPIVLPDDDEAEEACVAKEEPEQEEEKK